MEDDGTYYGRVQKIKEGSKVRIEEVKKYFKDKVYKSVIPRNVKLSEAPSFGLPIALYDKNSKGATAYMDLAKEVIRANKIKI